MTDEKQELLRRILRRREAELANMTAAYKKLTPTTMKARKLQPLVYRLAGTVEVCNEIYHSGAEDAEERIKGLFLACPLSEYAPPMDTIK